MLTYFLQVNVCWLLFYGVYYALLSKETFFKLNRLWLISSLLCGLGLPFAADYFAVKVAPTFVFSMTLEPFVVTAKALQQNLTVNTEGVVLKTIGLIYGLGCAILTARFVAGLFLIFKILKQAKIDQQDGFKLAFTEGGVPPFSFFNCIFINPNEFENYDFQQIMQHEKAHVYQRHSFDVMFLEILNIVFWCSPLIYFYKNSLRNVHEYLADEAVLRHNATPQYGRLLLRQRQSGRALSLTSNISNHFFSQLKKRILMMTRNKSKRTALIKYALAAPIFLILTAALTSPKTPILAKTEALSDKVTNKLEKADFNTFLTQVVDNQIIMSDSKDTAPPNISANMKKGVSYAYIGGYNFGKFITASEMQKIDRLKVVYLEYDGQFYEGTIQSYVLVKVTKNQDPTQVNVTGNINNDAKKVLEQAKEGDFYQFLNIKARWSNDLISRDIGALSFMIASPQYSAAIDTSFKPLSDLKLVDEKQIERMNIESKEAFNTRITITFKDGHVEYFKGAKADMEKALGKENLDAAKLEAEQKALIQEKQKLDDEQKAGQQAGKLDELVVVGKGSQKNMAEQKAQKLEDEKKALKQQMDKQQAEKNGADPVFTVVEQSPEFPQGIPALYKFLGENIKYPKSARDAGGQGTVYVGFIVETDGAITNVNIKRDAPVIIHETITIIESNGVKGNKIVEKTDYSLGKEAVRVIWMMPKWKPGKQDGKAVRVAYTLPIKFKLD